MTTTLTIQRCDGHDCLYCHCVHSLGCGIGCVLFRIIRVCLINYNFNECDREGHPRESEVQRGLEIRQEDLGYLSRHQLVRDQDQIRRGTKDHRGEKEVREGAWVRTERACHKEGSPAPGALWPGVSLVVKEIEGDGLSHLQNENVIGTEKWHILYRLSMHLNTYIL